MKHIQSNWTDVVLVCRKCSRRLGGGFGKKGKTRLSKFLRDGLDLKKGRKARVGIVEVGCLDICPKHGVTAIRGKSPGDWVVIPEGEALDEVVARLGLDDRKPE